MTPMSSAMSRRLRRTLGHLHEPGGDRILEAASQLVTASRPWPQLGERFAADVDDDGRASAKARAEAANRIE